MPLPSLEIKDWVLEPRGKETGLKAIYITQMQADAVQKVWRNSPNADLRDKHGSLREIVNRNDYRIKRMESDQSVSDATWVCDYGHHHTISKSCECREKYKVHYLTFLKWCQKHYKIGFPHQIETHMQEEFLRVHTI